MICDVCWKNLESLSRCHNCKINICSKCRRIFGKFIYCKECFKSKISAIDKEGCDDYKIFSDNNYPIPY